MADPHPVARDDRVLPATRALAWGITPFLLAGFVILYVVPGRTETLFAWTIVPSMTSMLLASAYLGGVYFFLQVTRERHWHAVRAGFPAVALFAALLGVTTVVHWDRFHHGNPAFWVWAAVYLVAPFLVAGVWAANRPYGTAPTPLDPRLGRLTAGTIAAASASTLALGAAMVLVPSVFVPLWPWSLTPLTARVVGAILCLGLAGLVVLTDRRVSTLLRLLEVALVMGVSALIATVRARDQLDTSRPMTWLMLAGIGVLVVGGGGLYLRLRSTMAAVPPRHDDPAGSP